MQSLSRVLPTTTLFVLSRRFLLSMLFTLRIGLCASLSPSPSSPLSSSSSDWSTCLEKATPPPRNAEGLPRDRLSGRAPSVTSAAVEAELAPEFEVPDAGAASFPRMASRFPLLPWMWEAAEEDEEQEVDVEAVVVVAFPPSQLRAPIPAPPVPKAILI